MVRFLEKIKPPNLRLLRFLEKIKPGFEIAGKINPAREKKRWYFRRFTGGKRSKGGPKGVQKVPQNFLKKIERLLRFLEKIKARFEIAEISGKNKTPF